MMGHRRDASKTSCARFRRMSLKLWGSGFRQKSVTQMFLGTIGEVHYVPVRSSNLDGPLEPGYSVCYLVTKQ
ncbi:hypothetical protein Poly41_00260 [Novipirellula artificiosorum]|uniref:Uncharacterized protein n=1 Tax=Novipirellula artificiosorum TaxID=2528016 RepID=A0A5C6DZU5_9BACT|nr:hypothetical protein Poly41_00260 [Novipirellula artificiosorum]